MNFLYSYNPEDKIKDTIIPEFHPGIQGDMKFKVLSPFLSPATREYLVPFVGRAFHEVLAVAVPGANDKIDEAVELSRRALIFYMVYKAIPTMLGNLSSLGFQVMNDREGTSRGPSQWAYYNTLRHGILEADKAMDQLLVFLDAQLGDPAFADYENDPAINYRRSRVFRQLGHLEEFWNIQGSRRAWNTITPYLNKAEKRSLKPVLGAELFTRLSTIADDQARSQVQSELIEHCRTYVAEVGLLAAIPHLSCVINGDGIVIVSSTDGFRQENASGLVNNQAAIARLQQDANTRAGGALKDLQDFLRTNADEFEDYTAPEAVESTGIIDSPGAVGLF